MIQSTNFGAMVGAPVVGPGDQKIGTVGQIFVDPNDGHANWMTVRTGWIGKSESFVPLDAADWDEERVHVKYDKDFIKGAPRIDTDGALTEPEERELYRHYGISMDGDRPDQHTDDPTAGSPSAYLDTEDGSHSDRPTSSDYRHTGTGRHSAARDDVGQRVSGDRPSPPGTRRMRRFVVTEIEVDEVIQDDELAAEQPVVEQPEVAQEAVEPAGTERQASVRPTEQEAGHGAEERSAEPSDRAAGSRESEAAREQEPEVAREPGPGTLQGSDPEPGQATQRSAQADEPTADSEQDAEPSLGSRAVTEEQLRAQSGAESGGSSEGRR